MLFNLKKLVYKIFKNQTNDIEEIKIIRAYRYLSLMITSFVYLTGKPYSIIIFKLLVVLSLSLSSIIISNLYTKFRESKDVLRTLILIETLGITLLLLPTEGLKSPFIWYALNPTLVAASFLQTYFCWMNMVFYLLTSTVMTYFFFNPQQYNLVELIFANDNNLILVFILITLVVQLLAGLTRKLSIQARALQELNSQKQESINHIMSLYQIIEAMNNNNSKDKLFETLAEYTAKLTKSDLCFCWLPGNIIEEDLFKVSNNLCNINLREIQLELRNMSEHSNTFSGAQELSLAGYYFLVMPIMIPSTPIGILAVQKQCNNSLGCYEQSNKLLEFLSGLSTVILERFNMEEIEDSLLIMNEQNRIANEIHDSVSQRLFSISYAIHGILGRWKTMSKKELYEYLIEINESSSNAMQELRNAIYQLSSKKKGEKTLQVTLKEFLDNIGKLHHIIVDLQIEGNEGLLSLSIKKAITRIIREACNNAVRHGRCQNINLILKINADLIYLSIADDGNGFTIINDISGKEYGLGLSNIQSLVSSFNGNININSTVGEGTNIKITMPIKEYIKLSKEDTLYESNIG